MDPYALLAEAARRPQASFVFPSEVCARFWLQEWLRRSGCHTAASERFLSWDQFKERCFELPSGSRPMNRAGRLLFLCALLERNRQRPFFAELIRPEHAADPLAFLPALQRMLPALHHLERLRHVWPPGSLGKLHDLLTLWEEYRSFLAATGRCEPAWIQPRFDPRGGEYHLFYPQLIEDFEEYRQLLAGHPSVRTLPAPAAPPPGGARVVVFETIVEELASLLGEVAQLLDSGAAPETITLSVCDLGGVEPALRRQAELYELPLAVRLGRPVSSFPVSRLFLQLRDCLDSGFSLSSLKALLLNLGLPWKQQELARGLPRLGVQMRVVKNVPGRDMWEGALRSAASLPLAASLPVARLKGYYRRLQEELQGLERARSFGELKARLAAFCGAFLDVERWGQQELRVFQFALDTLEELAEEGELPLPAPAFRVWLQYLQQRLYVPPVAAGGVPVYPYPVAEGTCPEHHFLLNASQADTSRPLRRYPFLAAHEEEQLGAPPLELSAAHLLLYSHSGQQVRFSYSRRNFLRVNLPPALFVTSASWLQDVGLPGGERAQQEPYELERGAWETGGQFPLHRIQATAFRRAAATALAPAGLDATRQPLADPGVAARLQERLQDAEGRLRLSATSLEAFTRCPFAFLLQRALGIEEQEFEPVISDPRELGLLLHQVFQLHFQRQLERGGAGVEGTEAAEGVETGGAGAARGARGQRAGAEEALRRAVAHVFARYRSGNPIPLWPIWRRLRREVLELARRFLRLEREQMGAEQTVAAELRLRAEGPSPATVLVGTVDRLSRGPSGLTLTEYKKNVVPGRQQIFGPDPTSFQMPFYLHLLQAEGMEVSRAAYYSAEEGRYHFVFGGPGRNMADPERMRQAVAALQERTAGMVRCIARGDYSLPDGAATGCRFCRLAALCRDQYVLG
jgi:RecB family exonuclease